MWPRLLVNTSRLTMGAQVLNNRMFDNGANKPTLKAEQREMGEAGERDFKFQLPEDEEGQVR